MPPLNLPELDEKTAFLVLAAGLVVFAIGFFWLVVRAFGTGFGWGLASLIPGLNLVYAFTHFRRAWAPLLVMLLGGAAVAAPILYARFVAPTIDLGERDKIVDGERHLTLTGWDKTDYGAIRQRPDTVVLFMANADVTDATLEQLKDLKQLRELDLNDTQVTDEGLKVLAELPALEVVKLARTKATPDGIRKHLLTHPKLKDLDVRGLNVPTGPLREWKNADPQNRKYAN
jgi:hypothetical protein